jgi:SAM-dependent methyltransferase
MTGSQSTEPRQNGASRTLHRLVGDPDIHRSTHEEHRRRVLRRYGGPQGALLAVASTVSGHLAAGDRMLRERRFDLRGVNTLLDIGSGAGQLIRPILKYGEPGIAVVGCDLSSNMLRRARARLKDDRPAFSVADLAHLPFASESFDAITCGYVLEHLPDARVGLREMARVLNPGGRILLLVTEDSFSGAFTSRLWCCRTHNRAELREMCCQVGLDWHKELWFSRWHQVFKAGGICVDLRKH